jgi:hypothetical protein
MYENLCDIFGYLDICWSSEVKQNLVKKQPVLTCRLFSKKFTGFDIWKGFGGDLEHPNIWLFEHLDR